MNKKYTTMQKGQPRFWLMLVAICMLPSLMMAQLNIGITTQQPTCNGYTNGRAIATVTGGATPYYFRWSTGQQGAYNVHEGIGAGNYSVTVTDANNVTTIQTFVMGQPTAVAVSVAPVGGVCGGAGQNHTAVATGGTPNYTFGWSTGATGNTLTAPAAGGYFVTTTDAASCQSVTFVNITEAMRVEVEGVPVLCGGMCDGSANAQVYGGATPYQFLWNFQGRTTQTIFPLPGGSYTVTVTDARGCVRTATGIVEEPAPLALSLTYTGDVCSGTAGARVQGSNGRPPYRYQWSTGATTQAVTNLSTGTYFVTVFDINNCPKDTTVIISNSALAVTTTANDALCSGVNNGYATANVPSGVGPYRFAWSNGATTQTATNLGAGNYTVTVTDAAGCTRTSSATIVAQRSISATAATTNTACGASTGGATVTPVGTVGAVTYAWSNGGATPTIVGVPAGTYRVTVTDGDGCQAVVNNVVVNSTTAFSVAPVIANAVCSASNGGVQLATTGGNAPYTYTVGTTSNTTGNFTGLAAGNYTVTIRDNTGCQSSANFTVGQATNTLTTNASPTNAACGLTNGRIQLATSGGTAPYTYTSGTTTNTTGLFDGLGAGAYNFTVVDANGCTGTLNNVSVTASANTVTAAATRTNATCGRTNGQIAVVGSGGVAPYTYRLNATTANNTGVFTGLPVGSYIVQVTDANGCTFSTPLQSVANAGGLSAAIGVTPVSCTGTDNLTVRFVDQSTGAPAATRAWLFSNGTTSMASSNDVTFTGVTSGTARLIVQSAEGCVDTITRNIGLDVLRITINRDTIQTCQGAQVALNVRNDNPNSTPQYSWTGPAGVTITGGATASPSVRPTAAGVYNVILVTTNALGCSRRDTVPVAAFANTPSDTALITATPNCQNGLQVNLNNTNATAGSYTWSVAPGTLNGTTATFATAGTYTIRLIPRVGCLDTLTRRVTVTAGPVRLVDAGRDTAVCSAAGFTLRAVGNTATTYTWSRNRDFSNPIGTAANVTVNPTGRGVWYYVRLSDGRCTAIDSVRVSNDSIQIRRDTAVNLCAGGTRQTTYSSAIAGDVLTYAWTASTGLTLTGANTNAPTVGGTQSGTIAGVITNQSGCTLRDTMRINYSDLASQFTIAATPDTILKGQTSILRVTPNLATWTYKWSPDIRLSNANGFESVATPDTSTTYNMTITDRFGCQATKSKRITVLQPECGVPYVFVPNVFSPNGDGINEKFFVHSEYVTECTLIVYNRWGEEVYRVEKVAHIQEYGWDGTHKNLGVCPDVYGWYVSGICREGQPFFLKGNVSVMK